MFSGLSGRLTDDNCKSSLCKLLRYHQSVFSTIKDADANVTEGRSEDIGTMAWGMHEPLMRDRQRGGQCYVFSCGRIVDAGSFHALKRREAFRRLVREITTHKHVAAMLTRNISQ